MPASNATTLARAFLNKQITLDQIPSAQRPLVQSIIDNGAAKPTTPHADRLSRFTTPHYRSHTPSPTPPTRGRPKKDSA